MKIRATLVELYQRFINYDEKQNIYLNGFNNLYPNEIAGVAGNSPTAKRASNMMSKFLVGKGLTQDVMLDRSKNYRLSDFVKAVADDISVQYGCFVHVSYRLEGGVLIPSMPKVLPYVKCRIQKFDDKDNAGFISVKDYEKKADRNKKPKLYYPYNNNQDVLLAQIMQDAKEEGLKDATLETALPVYRGQVLYINLTPSQIYACSLFDAVYNDCDTEYRIGLYSNNVIRTGFLGKVAVITQGLDEEQAEMIDVDIKNWLGAENSGSVYRLDLEQTVNIDEAFKILSVPTNFDEAQFTKTKEGVRENILGAVNNIPEELVMSSKGIFSSSGEAYKQMKLFYSEQTEYERNKINDLLYSLGFDAEIIPIITEEEANTPTE